MGEGLIGQLALDSDVNEPTSCGGVSVAAALLMLRVHGLSLGDAGGAAASKLGANSIPMAGAAGSARIARAFGGSGLRKNFANFWRFRGNTTAKAALSGNVSPIAGTSGHCKCFLI